LRKLSENRCPECGGEFDPDDASTYYHPKLRARERANTWKIILWICVSVGLIWLLVLAGGWMLLSWMDEGFDLLD
jgi:hypothetical protein